MGNLPQLKEKPPVRIGGFFMVARPYPSPAKNGRIRRKPQLQQQTSPSRL
nr:MAG TPA: hypothetical protein [Caudoviricetes sp.]